MNLFLVTFLASIALGTSGALGSANTLGLVYGFSVGVLSYLVCLCSGAVVMKLAPGKGIENSNASTFGGWLLLVGAVISPALAYYMSRYLF